MKLIYTHENRFLVNNARNLVERAGIAVVLRNEYAVGGAGDLSPFDTWLELWIEHDSDYVRALQVLQDANGSDDATPWTCSNCHELNAAAFDFCWYCQAEK
jgi:hypothetical protein